MSFILFLGTGQASQCVCSFLRKMGLKINPPWFFLLLFMNCSHVLQSLVFLIIFEERFLWSKIFVLNLYYLTIWYERPCIISRKIEIDWQKCLMCLWCHQISVYISVSRHVQTTWRRRRREEEREYSIFSTFLLWKHTFDRFTITNGYAHLSLFTYVLDKIKTEFETIFMQIAIFVESDAQISDILILHYKIFWVFDCGAFQTNWFGSNLKKIL